MLLCAGCLVSFRKTVFTLRNSSKQVPKCSFTPLACPVNYLFKNGCVWGILQGHSLTAPWVVLSFSFLHKEL